MTHLVWSLSHNSISISLLWHTHPFWERMYVIYCLLYYFIWIWFDFCITEGHQLLWVNLIDLSHNRHGFDPFWWLLTYKDNGNCLWLLFRCVIMLFLFIFAIQSETFSIVLCITTNDNPELMDIGYWTEFDLVLEKQFFPFHVYGFL